MSCSAKAAPVISTASRARSRAKEHFSVDVAGEGHHRRRNSQAVGLRVLDQVDVDVG
ncbi:MAG: hypothetical protein GY811_28340 [Myxococcales bacterium]|nr:hypothetical protein [Myxococcales bacterium]